MSRRGGVRNGPSSRNVLGITNDADSAMREMDNEGNPMMRTMIRLIEQHSMLIQDMA